MKQTIPTGVFIAVAAVVLLIAAGVVWRGMQGAPEFKAPKTSKIVPNYVWDKLPQAEREKEKAEGYQPGDVQPTGQPGGRK
jgi:hypothetical protein